MTTAPDTPLISGGPIRHRQPAFALLPLCGERAHYWSLDWTLASNTPSPRWAWLGWTAACGITGLTQQDHADRLEPGNFPRCKRCARIRKRLEPPA